jgi:hypothetical protein
MDWRRPPSRRPFRFPRNRVPATFDDIFRDLKRKFRIRIRVEHHCSNILIVSAWFDLSIPIGSLEIKDFFPRGITEIAQAVTCRATEK